MVLKINSLPEETTAYSVNGYSLDEVIGSHQGSVTYQSKKDGESVCLKSFTFAKAVSQKAQGARYVKK